MSDPILAAEEKAERATRRAAVAEARLRAIEQSTIWKASRPLRRILKADRGGGRHLRLGLQLVWWTVTLKLPSRLRQWRERRGAPALHPMRRLADLITKMPDPSSIVVPFSAEPVVSVVIPTYGQVEYTLRCLASIAMHPPVVAFEVVVAEDSSGDPEVPGLRAVRGIRLIENASNLGFLHNANQAASQARGEFVFFLNNDTQVQDGWLDTLVDLLRRRPEAGAAGSKLVYPDGRLQEAGGIVWDDASGWNYGSLDDPDLPVYNYVREVDYISGAALLVRRALFEELGGFDPHFAPAYCEDSDLSFRLRARGHLTLYQPASVVVHFEGISHGTDIGRGVKASQVANQRKFAVRWKDVLEREHCASGTDLLRAREHARRRSVVLVIDHYVPRPDRDAGSRTMIDLLRCFLDEGAVAKFWPGNGAYFPGYTESLQQMGVEVLYSASAGSFDAWIEENGASVDVVLLSRPHTAEPLLGTLRRHTSARLAYYGHDLHFARMRMQAERTGDVALLEESRAVERLERSVWRRVDVVLYPSAEEVSCVASLEPGVTARVLMPYAFDRFASPRAPVAGSDILFVAGFAHPPNEDGAVWFVSAVLPLVRQSVPEARLLIVGSNPTDRVRALAGGAVSLHANVSDLALHGFYAAARVTVVPLRFGAGVKLKVVEALREGVPLVTTPVGAQGCEDLDQVVAVRSEANEFAEAVIRLLGDDAAWAQSAAGQVAYAKARFSMGAMRASLESALRP